MMSNIFDDRIVSSLAEGTATTSADQTDDNVATTPQGESDGQYTAAALKDAVQELLKFGVLEAERKPNLYQTALTQRAAIDRILEPLDLRLQLDEVRGLAFVAVASTFHDGDEDWNHPLVRRQRLTLEQSLLVALLRQLYVIHEQEQGIGASAAVVHLDDLVPQLQIYLGSTGSDAREQKRLRNLLEQLKGHGLVSDIDDKECFTIRPLITHLANPQSLQNLLQHYRRLSLAPAAEDTGEGDSLESLE